MNTQLQKKISQADVIEPHNAAATRNKTLAAQCLAGKRAAMVVYSPYPADPRPRRAADALLEEGMSIDLVCEAEDGFPAYEDCGALTITRVPIQRERGSALSYMYNYSMFIAWSAAVVAWRTLRKPYDLVYVHNMPDILVATGIFPRLFGARVILDQHDPMPELMMTIFEKNRDSFAVRLMESMEKWSLGRADQVITVNEACRKIFAGRSCPVEKIGVVMNTPDEKVFAYRAASSYKTRSAMDPFVIMFHGGLVERNGLELVIDAFAMVQEELPNAELRVYGGATAYLQRVLEKAARLGVKENVHYYGPKSIEDLVPAIEAADIGVIPNQYNPFTEINTPTRIFEYLSLGKPVIAPATSGIRDYFDDKSLLFFEPGNADDLASKLEYAFSFPSVIRETTVRGQEVYTHYTWQQEKQALLRLVTGCLEN